jgi:hypothetical protein
MFERFTEQARRVLFFAREEAGQLRIKRLEGIARMERTPGKP